MADNIVRLKAVLDDKVSGPLEKIRDNFDRLGGKGSAASLFGNVGAKAVAKGFDLISAGASKAVDFVADSVDAASDLAEATTKSAAVFGPASREIEAWAGTASRSIGQSKRQALEAAGTFGNLFDSMGLAEDASVDMSKRIVELSSDLSSFNNVPTDEALLALRSGLVGEIEPLRKFGVAINAATVENKALEMGLADTKAEITEADKVMARYRLILEQTTNAQGDFTRTSDGMANQQRILSALAEDTSAKFGQVLLPAVIEFQRTVINLLDNTSMSMDEVGAAAARGSQAAQARFRAMGGEAELWRRQMDEAADLVKDDLYEAGEAYEGLGDKARTTSGRVATSTDAMIESSRKLRDAFIADANAIIADYYDPIEARTELKALKREEAEQREIIASKKSTKEQIRDAKERLTEIERRQTELIVSLGKTGDATGEELRQSILDYQEAWRTASKESREEIDRIIRKLTLLRLAQLAAGGYLPGGGAGQGGGGRAEGGPVDPDKVYIVGEKGPELFVSKTAGTIIPNDVLSGASGGSSGGPWSQTPASRPAPVVIHSHLYLDGREIAASVEAAGYYEYAVSTTATGPA